MARKAVAIAVEKNIDGCGYSLQKCNECFKGHLVSTGGSLCSIPGLSEPGCAPFVQAVIPISRATPYHFPSPLQYALPLGLFGVCSSTPRLLLTPSYHPPER